MSDTREQFAYKPPIAQSDPFCPQTIRAFVFGPDHSGVHRQPQWQVDALSLTLQDIDVYAFPLVAILGQVFTKLLDQGCLRMILVAPGWPNMVSTKTEQPLVLGSCDHVGINPPVSTKTEQPPDTALQWMPAQGSSEHKPACLTLTAPAIQQEGFSDEVATRIEAPQRLSTQTVH